MTWTDESGNPLCECGHLWSNHHQKIEVYHCEVPDCYCSRFSEQSAMDEFTDALMLMEEDILDD